MPLRLSSAWREKGRATALFNDAEECHPRFLMRAALAQLGWRQLRGESSRARLGPCAPAASACFAGKTVALDPFVGGLCFGPTSPSISRVIFRVGRQLSESRSPLRAFREPRNLKLQRHATTRIFCKNIPREQVTLSFTLPQSGRFCGGMCKT